MINSHASADRVHVDVPVCRRRAGGARFHSHPPGRACDGERVVVDEARQLRNPRIIWTLACWTERQYENGLARVLPDFHLLGGMRRRFLAAPAMRRGKSRGVRSYERARVFTLPRDPASSAPRPLVAMSLPD